MPWQLIPGREATGVAVDKTHVLPVSGEVTYCLLCGYKNRVSRLHSQCVSNTWPIQELLSENADYRRCKPSNIATQNSSPTAKDPGLVTRTVFVLNPFLLICWQIPDFR